MVSYFITSLAEVTDVFWVPVSGFLFFILFGARFGMIGGVLNFLEEIIPYTDVIPNGISF